MRTATSKQMKELDRIAIEERGIPSTQLMENAARAVAREAAASGKLKLQTFLHWGKRPLPVTLNWRKD